MDMDLTWMIIRYKLSGCQEDFFSCEVIIRRGINNTIVNIRGVNIMDLYKLIQRHYDLPSCELDYVFKILTGRPLGIIELPITIPLACSELLLTIITTY